MFTRPPTMLQNQAMVSTNLYKAETLSTLQRYVLQQCSRTLIVAP